LLDLNIDFIIKAHAFISHRTDHLIQATIRTQFKDCTVLTVAHRLNTILDNDRIMVLEAGNIVEFDTPSRLFEKSNGAFRKLIDEAGLDFVKFSRVKG
jgi:ATP-binding cassette subfamily C (CFTR/MRP) protein 1